jgi:hypothetical protein
MTHRTHDENIYALAGGQAPTTILATYSEEHIGGSYTSDQLQRHSNGRPSNFENIQNS